MMLRADVPDPEFKPEDEIEIILNPHWLIGKRGIVADCYWTNCNLSIYDDNLFPPSDDKWAYVVEIEGETMLIHKGDAVLVASADKTAYNTDTTRS